MEQVKIMLVDDEVLAIEYLRDLIPWEEKGYKIVAEATNGRKALDEYQKLHPQILIVDIRMPGMDGLELCRKVLDLGEPVKIILLTAHKDFGYAKQALELGVYSYLLKHNIREENLLSELDRARKSLEAEAERDQIICRQFIKEILGGRKKSASVSAEHRLVHLGQKHFFMLLYAQADRPYPVFGDWPTGTETEEIGFDPEQCGISPVVSYIDIFEMERGRYLILPAVQQSGSQKEALESLHRLALDLQRQYRDRTSQSISIVLGDRSSDIYDMHKRYVQAKETAGLGIFFGREKIYRGYEYEDRKDYRGGDIPPLAADISRAFEDMDHEAVGSGITALFDIALLPSPSREALDEICTTLVGQLEQIRKDHHMVPYADLPEERLEHLLHCYHIDDLKRGFVQEFHALRNEIARSHNYSRKMNEALQIIAQRYAADLSIEEVAHDINISAVYLSVLIKKETGQTFLKYLTDYRIRMAKQLLENSDDKIYEIAEKVGYKTSQYFIQVFGRTVGMSPNEYRKKGYPHEK